MSDPRQIPPPTGTPGGTPPNIGGSQGGRILTPSTPQSPTMLGTPTPLSPNPVYAGSPIESSELLLPPARPNRFQQYQDSPLSSRRTSWASASTGNRDSRYGPFASPFDDSRTPSRAASPDPMEPMGMQTITEKYNITPSAGLLLYPNDKEEDDDLHDPATGDKDTNDCSIFTRRGAINVGGLVLITAGLLMLFIGYPILTFAQDKDKDEDACSKAGALCIDGTIDFLSNVRTSLVDPDTPEEFHTKKSYDGTEFKLVWSDEFNTDNRSFYPGDDPFWEAVNIHYAATGDEEWYDPDQITTADGFLEITFAKYSNHDLDYRSGMLQSWNKLCYKGGIIEASISLPGSGDTSGFWPGFWTMGNLGRPGYLGTTEGMWPYTYHDECDVGITPNQSSSDGINWLPGMKLPGCTCDGEDHPNKGKARSAPEIDALEASVSAYNAAGDVIGSASQSIQVAPFDIWYSPNYDFMAVFDSQLTTINSYRGGVYQQAISGLSTLNNDWYDGNAYQTYGFEYTPGAEGEIIWNVGDVHTWQFKAESVGPNGNIGQRLVPVEPMSMVINFGMGESFAPIDDGIQALLPAKMRVDYVRIYQNPDDILVTCDPPDYPTTEYIEKHPKVYKNVNITSWEDADYEWPKNTFMNDC